MAFEQQAAGPPLSVTGALGKRRKFPPGQWGTPQQIFFTEGVYTEQGWPGSSTPAVLSH